MNRLQTGMAALLMAWSGGWGSAASACDYALESTKVLQCRPIALLDDVEGHAAWTYVEENGAHTNVLAHILCECEAALKTADSVCQAHQMHKLTFTQPTTDIMKTCAAQTALCQDACQQLISHK